MTEARRERDTTVDRLTEVLASGDATCAACGYSLRGLGGGARCPECGTPVARSVALPLLESVDRSWVLRFAGGARMVSAGVWAALATVVVVLGMAGAMGVLIRAGMFPGWTRPIRLVGAVVGIGGAASVGLVVVGSWRCAGVEAALERVAAVRVWRRGVVLALGTSLVAVAVGGGVVGIMVAVGSARVVAFDLWLLFVGFSAVMLVLVVVGFVREVMRHVPDAALGARGVRRGWRMLAALGVALIGFEGANTLLVGVGWVAEAAGWAVAAIGAGSALAWAALLAGSIGACARRVRASVGQRED